MVKSRVNKGLLIVSLAATMLFFLLMMAPMALAQGVLPPNNRISEAVCRLLGFIQGDFGALLMVIAGIVAIITAVMGAYRLALSLVVVAVASFILPALVRVFFDVDCPGFFSSSIVATDGFESSSGVVEELGPREARVSASQPRNSRVASSGVRNSRNSEVAARDRAELEALVSNNGNSRGAYGGYSNNGFPREGHSPLFAANDFRPGTGIVRVGTRPEAMTYSGKPINFRSFIGRLVVVEWFDPSCKYFDSMYESGFMQKMQRKYIEQGVVWLSVNSSPIGSQGYLTSAEAGDFTYEHGFSSSFVIDDSRGVLLQKFKPLTVPDFMIFNAAGDMAYHGAVRAVPSGKRGGSVNLLESSLEELLDGRALSIKESRSKGCPVPIPLAG